MTLHSRYLLLALPLGLLAACNQSANAPAPAATVATPEPATPARPAAAMSAPAAPGTSTIMVATPLPSRLDWNNLPSQVGKYQNQIDLFEHGPISVELKELLGDSLPVLRRNLEVAGPLQKDGDTYYMTGNAPHQGGMDQAYLLISPAQKGLEVGIWQNGKLSTWKTPDTSIAIPADVQRMLTNAKAMPAGAASGPPKAAPAGAADGG